MSLSVLELSGITEIKAAWDAITPERCQKLISSTGCRCQAVTDSKGYPTKY